MTAADIQSSIFQKIHELSSSLGRDSRSLKASDALPSSGLLDSAALVELMLWYETEFDLSIPPEDFSFDRLGSVNQMAEYVARNGQK